MSKRPVSKVGCLLTLCFIAYYVPAYYAVPRIITKIWRQYYVLVSLLSVDLLIYVSRGFHLSRRCLAALLYFAWFYFGSFLLSADGTLNIYPMIRCIGFVSLMELSFLIASERTVMKAFLTAGILMTSLQFLTFFLYSGTQGGMRNGDVYIIAGFVRSRTTQNWYFLTYDNDSVNFFLPVMAVLLCYAVRYNRKAWFWFCLYSAVVLYMFLKKTSATALVATGLFLLTAACVGLAYLYPALRPCLRFFSLRKTIIAGLLIEIIPPLIVDGPVARLIGSVFGKKASFTGRAGIWRRGLYYISEHPFTGNGIESVMTRWRKLQQTHCHNLIIDNLYVGGVVALILLIAFFMVCVPAVTDPMIEAAVAAAILSFLLAASMDWLSENPVPMALFFFAGCAQRKGKVLPHRVRRSIPDS